MKKFRLEDMIGGWFVGDFTPSIVKESNFEVAIKKYKSGTKEKKHLHKLAYEITVIISGKVLMNNKEFKEGDIIKINKGESTDFITLEDTITCVVKSPSVQGDKYVLE